MKIKHLGAIYVVIGSLVFWGFLFGLPLGTGQSWLVSFIGAIVATFSVLLWCLVWACLIHKE